MFVNGSGIRWVGIRELGVQCFEHSGIKRNAFFVSYGKGVGIMMIDMEY